MQWKARLRLKQILWMLTAKAIWHQSKTMRIDYRRHPLGLPFHTWLRYRVFGDDRGYRWTED